MNQKITLICVNDNRKYEVPAGTPLSQIAASYSKDGRPCLAAFVNNRIKELDYRVHQPVTVRFIDITHYEGHGVCRRTAVFMLQKVVRELFPDRKLFVRHSLGSGFYCEISGMDSIDTKTAEAIREGFAALAAADIPISRRRLLTDEVREIYNAHGFSDKTALLDTRPRLYSDIYVMADEVGYFYGALAPSTGCIALFDICPCYEGFAIMLPSHNDPDRLDRTVRADKMFAVFNDHKRRTSVTGLPTVAHLNAKTLAGQAGEVIRIAEAFQEKQLASIADAIAAANDSRGLRTVFIAGPSSSGKTTFAKRLGIQLRISGLTPVPVSLDDYFVDRDKTPRDENGDYDYEAPEAVNLALFNRQLQQLLSGQSVRIPRYDFITGCSVEGDREIKLGDRSVLLIEGIHGLNPALTPGVPDDQKFKIYVSCFTTIAMDNLSRISTSDNRLLRRLIRDSRTRGAGAVATLSRWAGVRRGEEKYIFPYQENADVMFNSSLFYELPVLRRYAEPLLREVPDTTEAYAEARRMLKFLDNFTPMDAAEIPPASLLREFIGGSAFQE
ncbi:MAG: nucleoside kinase [Alistipes sp.]|nr:nucleoside kinase [Alistipes sp.]